jgi:tellurite resistance protein TerC
MLALDLGVFNRKAHVIGAKEALLSTLYRFILALLFNVLVYFIYQHHWFDIGINGDQILVGKDAALKFFTGYIIEQTLSMDNIFIIALIFSYFHVPDRLQHRVLFWGILGAVVMRGVMIFLGVALIQKFSWMIYVFGVLLLITAVKMLISRQDNIEPEKNPIIKLARRLFPVTTGYENENFFSRINGKLAITPLFLVLLVIENTDVIFAVDSIPAIFAITTDPFIIFTSNIFAILGLRTLYFALAAVMGKFKYLKISLVFLLAYVGVKMILSHHYPIPTFVSLCVIAGILAVGVLASIYDSDERRGKQRKESEVDI